MHKHRTLCRALVRPLLIAFLLVGTLATSSPSASAAGAFYVSTQGDDGNPGTQSQPWRTIQYAVNNAGAGSTVIVADGHYDERPTISVQATANAPLVVRAENRHQASCNGFTLSGARHVTVDGFDLQSLDANERRGSGVHVTGGTLSSTIENCYIHETAWYGVNVGTDTSNVIVRNNRVYRAYMAGIIVWGSGHLIEGNEIWGTVNFSPSAGQTLGYDQDGIRFFGSDLTFRGNYIHDIKFSDARGDNMPHIDAFQTWSNPSATNCIIENNVVDLPEVYDTRAYAKFANLEHASGLIIRNNVIRAVAIIYSDGLNDSDVLGNTFVQSPDASFWRPGIQITNGDNNEILNNVFYGNLNGGAEAIRVDGDSTGNVYDYNGIYDDDGSPPGRQQPHDVWDVDPQIGAFPDVRPSASSPLIGRGVAHPNLPTDKDGTARTNPPDIGAFQNAGAAPPPTSAPTTVPTEAPTTVPTQAPTADPTQAPTTAPTAAPTAAPTRVETPDPTAVPTTAPTAQPTATFSPSELVVDNEDPAFSTSSPHGTWIEHRDDAGQHYAASHVFNEQASGGQDTATWSFSVPTPGAYEVYAWWWEGSWRPADVPYTMQHADGSTIVRVSQQSDGGQWNSLGTYRFDGTGAVSVSDDVSAGTDIVADAVRLVYVGESVEPQPEPQPTPTATPGKWWKKRPSWFDKRAVWLSFQTTDGIGMRQTVARDEETKATLIMDTGLSPVYALDLTIAYPEGLGEVTVHPDTFANGFALVEDQTTPGILRLSLRRAEATAGSGELITLILPPGAVLEEAETIQVTDVTVNDGHVASVLDPGFLGGAKTFLPMLTRGH